jgi:hypothetical protein
VGFVGNYKNIFDLFSRILTQNLGNGLFREICGLANVPPEDAHELAAHQAQILRVHLGLVHF